MKGKAEIARQTQETDITIKLKLDGRGSHTISTGIGFFDHMLVLFAVHGFFDLVVEASGDIEVDFHHTVEDVGLVLGDALNQALGDRKGLHRYGYAVTPMDDALATVAVDLSKRPYLVFNVAEATASGSGFNIPLAKEFFRALAHRTGMNLHINVLYGENEHHIIESIFKGVGRALDQAITQEPRLKGVRSSKGKL
jgi:imidazoleglycerol-phosphate dehydratase